jgi:hypothetical protein
VTSLYDVRVTGSIPVVGFLFQSFLGTDKGKQPFVLDERKQSLMRGSNLSFSTTIDIVSFLPTRRAV